MKYTLRLHLLNRRGIVRKPDVLTSKYQRIESASDAKGPFRADRRPGTQIRTVGNEQLDIR